MITINPPIPDSVKGVPQPKPKRQAGPVSVLASMALAATTIATAISFCRIFPGWGFLGPVAITVISVHAVLTLARALQWPVYVAVPIALATMATVIGMLYFRSTLFGFIPTRATWDAAWISLTDAFGLFRTTVAPVPSDSGFGVATALAMGTVAGHADTFAFRAFGRIESIVPCGLLFALGSSLGVDRNRLPVTALWLACVFIAVAVLRAAHGENGATWLGTRSGGRLGPTARAAIGLGGVAVLAGVVLGPRLPGVDDDAIINTRTRSGKGTEVLSPMVEVQSRLVNRSNTEMFTYALTGAPGYLRLASLGEFDGKSFTEEGSFADATDFVGDQPGGPVREVRQSIKITSLGGIWMPAVASAVSINPTAGFEYDPSSASLIRRDKLFNGMQYDLVSLVPVINPDELQASTSTAPDERFLSVPSDFPQGLVDTANEIVAGQTSIYNQMVTLQNWFRDGFKYNVNVSRGHSIRSIEGFLRAKEGYCEQFATTFAAFARAVGVPSRVAVGFTPGDKDSAGLYHVLGKHAHAWPEIWFDNVGWVPFEPTPGRGAPGAESYTGVQPAQEGGELTGTPDIAGPSRSPDNAPDGERNIPATTAFSRGENNLPRDLPNPDAKGATPAQQAAQAAGGIPTPWLVILGLLVAISAWAVLMPIAARALARRRQHDEIDDVVGSWDRAARWLGIAGAPRQPEETPVEHAERAWRATGVGRDQVRELALEATRAMFKPTPPSSDVVEHCRELSRRVTKVVRDQLSWRDRLRARFDPRLQ